MSVETGKVISFHYTVTDAETGQEIDASAHHGAPLSVLFGQDRLVPGLEREMVGMAVGERKRITVEAREAYGEIRQDLIQKIPREALGEIVPEKGMALQMQTPEGALIPMVVADFDEETVTVDLNHPLAGRDLLFEVEIVQVRDPTPEELAHG